MAYSVGHADSYKKEGKVCMYAQRDVFEQNMYHEQYLLYSIR